MLSFETCVAHIAIELHGQSRLLITMSRILPKLKLASRVLHLVFESHPTTSGRARSLGMENIPLGVDYSARSEKR